MSHSTDVMEKIVALCRRRGFIFGSSEIYGGIGGFWDYGPLGCELKKNIKDVWWSDMVRNPPPGPGGREFQMVGVDCSIIMNPKVWEASGHVGGFSDPMVDCKECKARFRADQVAVIDILLKGSLITSYSFEVSSITDPLIRGLAGAILLGDSDYPEVRKRVKEIWKTISNRAQTQFLKQPDLLREVTDRVTVELKDRFAGLVPESALRPAVEKIAENELATVGLSLRSRGFLNSLESTTGLPCPRCGTKNSLTEKRAFNLMFETFVGAMQDAASKAYLRPETAQGIFANFKNVMDSTRVKIPFGIAQVGKAFRNEINPRNYTFRSREFEQMEIEFFCKPDESMMWYEFWRDTRINWYTSLGIKSDKLRPRQQGKDELAHYSSACTDIEYLFPFSDEPQELEGVAHRGSYDLNQHGKFSRNDENAFAVIDESEPRSSDRATPSSEPGAQATGGATGQKAARFVPHVIEPSAGADRFTLAVICEAYSYDESRASPEFMKFHPRLAPIKAAVFPLVAKDGLPEIAEPIYREIKKHFPCQYDAKQSIGKRYARMDEAGTPFCFTIDGQSKVDGTVTVRNRDDASQIRIDKAQCLKYLRDHLGL
jgi:glycyl-tRNA synthetase